MRIPFISDLFAPRRLDVLEIQGGNASANGRGGSVMAGSGAEIANLLTGAGTYKDSSAFSRPNVARQYLTPHECFALMRGGLYRRISSIRPAWATRSGWSCGSEAVDKRLTELGFLGEVRKADTWGRATGEYRLWVLTDARDQSRPMGRKERVIALHGLDRREFRPVSHNVDAYAGPLGRPDVYQVNPLRPGCVFEPQNVHASRLLEFYGHDLAPSEHGVEGWGDRDSIGQVIWTALSGLDTTTNSGARIASELMVSIFKLSGAAGVLAGDEAAGMIEKMTGINVMKSLSNAIWLGVDEDFERSPANVAGYSDLSNQARLMLSAVEGTPQTLLYGMPPSGFSTDGESWQEMWFADVAQHQEDRYRIPIETLARQVAQSEEIELTFRPLGELDAAERAQVRLAVTQADIAAIGEGILSRDEARSRYAKAGKFLDVFEVDLAEFVEADPELVDPVAEAEALAMVQAAEAAAAAPRVDSAVDGGAGSGWIFFEVDPASLEGLPPDAHLTMLCMGQIEATTSNVDAIKDAMREIAEDDPVILTRFLRTSFKGAPGEGRPVVYEASDAWALEAMANKLLRSLAHIVTARQYESFRPHITIRYDPLDASPPAPVAVDGAVTLSRLVFSIGQGIEVFAVNLGEED